MAGIGVEIKILSNDIPRRLTQMPRRVQNARRQAAERIAEGARRRSRVRTGEMKAGWTVEHGAESSEVTNPVEHTLYNEYGTVHMPAQPMLTPAVEEERARFVDAVIEAVRDA